MLKQFFISCAITAFLIFPFAAMVAFKGECQHVFVEIKKPVIQMHCHITEHPMMRRGVTGIGAAVGSHQQDHDKNNVGEGIAIVCVKCHVEGKQKIHYTHDE
jgi:hypothetical protein